MLLIKSSVPSLNSLTITQNYNLMIGWRERWHNLRIISVLWWSRALAKRNPCFVKRQHWSVSTPKGRWAFAVETIHKRNSASIWGWNPRGRRYQNWGSNQIWLVSDKCWKETILGGERKMASQWTACSKQDPASPLEEVKVKAGSSLQFKSLHKVKISWLTWRF